MAKSFISNILDNLETEMNDKIQAVGNYDTSPQIVNGPAIWDNVRKPCVWFVPSGDLEFTEQFAQRGLIKFGVDIWGFSEADGYGDTTKMEELLKDVLYFLWNDYTIPVFFESAEIYPGGSGDASNESGFMIKIKIVHSVNKSTVQ